MSSIYQSTKPESILSLSTSSIKSSASELSPVATKAKQQQTLLASRVCGAHFCLSEDVRSLEPVQLIHNLAWSLIHADKLNDDDTDSHATFKQLLNENGSRLIKTLINKEEGFFEPDLILKKCIIEPLVSLFAHNPDLLQASGYLFFLIDGLDTKPPLLDSDRPTLGAFLFRNLNLFPKCFKFLITMRSDASLVSLKQQYDFNYSFISLENNDGRVKKIEEAPAPIYGDLSTNLNHYLIKDLNDYIAFRINKSVDIQKNILYFNCSSSGASSCSASTNVLNDLPAASSTMSPQTLNKFPNRNQNSFTTPNYSTLQTGTTIITSPGNISKIDSSFQLKFVNYLSSISQSSFLFVKLTLDLIEKGCLIVKSSNFKVLPKSLDDLFRWEILRRLIEFEKFLNFVYYKALL